MFKCGSSKIILATQNLGKLKEFSDLSNLNNTNIEFEIKSINQDIGEISETGKTYLDNALIKANAVYNFYKSPVLADDSGLELIDFKNIPGVHSARFAGDFAKDSENCQKVINLLKSKSLDSTPARYRCVLVYKPSLNDCISFEGIWNGKVITSPQGTKGFGYDPIFIPDGYTCTSAELEEDEKKIISHRGQALKEFFYFIKNRESL